MSDIAFFAVGAVVMTIGVVAAYLYGTLNERHRRTLELPVLTLDGQPNGDFKWEEVYIPDRKQTYIRLLISDNWRERASRSNLIELEQMRDIYQRLGRDDNVRKIRNG